MLPAGGGDEDREVDEESLGSDLDLDLGDDGTDGGGTRRGLCSHRVGLGRAMGPLQQRAPGELGFLLALPPAVP